MEPTAAVQEATMYFFIPVACAYLFACGAWFAVQRWRPDLWPKAVAQETQRRWLDLFLVFAVGGGILGIGQLYRAGYLLPTDGEGLWRALLWNLDNVIIYSPIAIVLFWRKQSPGTAFLATEKIGRKIGLGIVIGVASVLLFVTMRGEWGRLPGIAARVFALDAIENFFPVFMEAVAMAYVFVRLRWVVGLWPAIAIPAVFFAVAHIPGSLEEGRSFAYIAAFFVFNGTLTTAILYTVQRSRDVIWIGVVHYLMDIAIEAF